jgi:hypothetical protein
MDDFVDWIDSVGGIPQGVPDAYADMRNAGIVLSTVG